MARSIELDLENSCLQATLGQWRILKIAELRRWAAIFISVRSLLAVNTSIATIPAQIEAALNAVRIEHSNGYSDRKNS